MGIQIKVIVNYKYIICQYKICHNFTYAIEIIDAKFISVCLINDYSLIADLHIFVY